MHGPPLIPIKYIVCLSTVNISNYYGDISETSDMSSEAVRSLPTGVQGTRNKTGEEKEITQTHNPKKDAVFQGSSSISDSQSVPNHKKHKRKTALKTSKVAVDSRKQLVKENKNSNPTEGTFASTSQVKTEGMQRYEKKDETEEEKEILSTGEKQVNEAVNRYSTDNQGKRAILYEEQDKKGEDVERPERSSTAEEAAQEEESPHEDMESVRDREPEKGRVGEEEEGDGGKGDGDEKSRSSGRMSKEDDNESYQEGHYSEALASDSERNIQDR